jgi:hypothetical protein
LTWTVWKGAGMDQVQAPAASASTGKCKIYENIRIYAWIGRMCSMPPRRASKYRRQHICLFKMSECSKYINSGKNGKKKTLNKLLYARGWRTTITS